MPQYHDQLQPLLENHHTQNQVPHMQQHQQQQQQQQQQQHQQQQQNTLKLPEPRDRVQVQLDPGSPRPAPRTNGPTTSPLTSRAVVPASKPPVSPGSGRTSRDTPRRLTPQDALFNSLVRGQCPRSPSLSPSHRSSPSVALTEEGAGADGVIDVNRYRSIVHGNCLSVFLLLSFIIPLVYPSYL